MTRMNYVRAARSCRRTAVLAVTALAGLAALPAVASAALTVFVSNEPVKGPFNSCASPGYKGIQEAVTANPAKTTIHVCSGVYKEQVTIEKSESIVADAGATLQLGTPANSTTSCDVQEPTKDEQQDLVTVCKAGKVKISGLTLEGRWPELGCAKDYNDIMVGGNSALTLTGSKILHAGVEPLNGGNGGCQQGIGIQVGRNKIGTAGTVKLSNDLIEGYQKNGITVDGPGSKAKIQAVTVKTEPSSLIARNGIQVGRGAIAKITGSTVTGNECNAGACGANPLAETQSSGVLIFGTASGVKVGSSNISKNDNGIYYAAGFESPAPSESTAATMSGNTLEENRYEGMVLEEGTVKLTNNSIIGNGKANVGIMLLQFEGNTLGLKATGKGDAVTGMTKCAVEGLSDKGAGDKLETLILKSSLSKFSGNTQPLCNNNEAKIVISVS